VSPLDFVEVTELAKTAFNRLTSLSRFGAKPFWIISEQDPCQVVHDGSRLGAEPLIAGIRVQRRGASAGGATVRAPGAAERRVSGAFMRDLGLGLPRNRAM
jgi:hypothetical protein